MASNTGGINMRVAVIGAGVTGIASAYYLSARGHDVVVMDKAKEVAAETSHANGGQLSYSFTDALARPSFIPGIPRLLAGLDPAIRVNLLSRPALPGWGLRFLRECTAARAAANTVAVLKLALRSAQLMASIRADTGIEFAFDAGGKLVLLPADADLDGVRAGIALKKQHGAETELLTMQQAERVEPALTAFTGHYGGAIYSKRDEVGDPRLFCRGLANWLQQTRNVQLVLDTKVQRIVSERGGLAGVATGNGLVSVDAVIVCAGCESPRLLRPLGVAAAIYPVRGYSITLPRGTDSPQISVTDLAQKMLYCPLGGKMRISGFADFYGNRRNNDRRRIETLRSMAIQAAPGVADYSEKDALPWAASRPMTPDGRPLVGPSRSPGVFLNSGHGALGWTLAAATGEDLARSVDAFANQK